MGLGGLLTTAAFLGIGAAGILLLAGYLSAGTASSTLTVSPGGAGSTPSCKALCDIWNSWRSLACTALAASTAATAALAAANAALASAMSTAALLLAAAVAASFIPFIGPAIAGPLFAAYLAAQAVVVFLLGRQLAAGAGGQLRRHRPADGARERRVVSRRPDRPVQRAGHARDVPGDAVSVRGRALMAS
jgi:hypothetical protein